MIACPVCGFRNVSGNVRCLKCNALIQADEAEVRVSTLLADEKSRRERRWLPWKGKLQSLWRQNPLRPLWRLPEMHVAYRFPFTAGLLSLIPGLGQLYNRQWGKALVVGTAWWLGFVICLLTLTQPFSNLFLILLLLGWLLIWNDSVATAVRINGEHWSFRSSIALWFAAMFLTGLLVTGTQFLGMNHMSLVRVLDTVHEPGIKYGDIVLTNHMAYWFSQPELGEVVYFDPARFKIEQTSSQLMNDAISVNVKDYYQRLAGMPGDVIEKREGRIWRNGAPLPPQLEPFGTDQIPEGEKFEVPPDHYWLPVTSIPADAFGVLIGVPQIQLGQRGWVFIGWREATLVPRSSIRGKGVAILNPAVRRRWLTED